MKTLYRSLVHKLLVSLAGNKFCILYNVVMTVNGRRRRCRYVDGLYRLEDGPEIIYFSRTTRYRYFSEGIENRIENLFSQYVGGYLEIREGDVVLDCGSNIGEFSLYCVGCKATVFSFEPDPIEFKALTRNLEASAYVFPFALWYENTKLILSLQNESGDTTVLEGNSSVDSFTVEGRRLDSFDEIKEQHQFRLLKLEAEGFELEVLKGAAELLEKIEYIAADLGPERGDFNDSSLPGVVNFLINRGFLVERFFPGRSIVLFRNVALSNEEETEYD